MKKLSIVILSYNTRDVLRGCLASLYKVKEEADFEVIVVDNASGDGSSEMVRKLYPEAIVIQNQANLGFAKGNNKAREVARGEYILFLNSDTEMYKGTLKKSLEIIEKDEKLGALTCKLLLKRGGLDKDTRRSFPTPWVSLTHFSGLDRLFPKSSLFAKYWYSYISEDETHEIDVAQGAFFLTKKKILDKIGWFDEDYFLDGEDIDLCWKIKQEGYKILYYPKVAILHLKKASKKSIKKALRIKFAMSGVNSMTLFYRKRLWRQYPVFLNVLVLFGINLIKLIRLLKVLFS